MIIILYIIIKRRYHSIFILRGKIILILFEIHNKDILIYIELNENENLMGV
jgi:hypothetical protein